MTEEVIINQEKLYEVYTCSGNRITVKGVEAVLVDFSAGEVSFVDRSGEHLASFMLINIEGWRIAP